MAQALVAPTPTTEHMTRHITPYTGILKIFTAIISLKNIHTRSHTVDCVRMREYFEIGSSHMPHWNIK